MTYRVAFTRVSLEYFEADTAEALDDTEAISVAMDMVVSEPAKYLTGGGPDFAYIPTTVRKLDGGV